MLAIKISGKDGQADRVAATAEKKKEVFTAQAFPSQAIIEEIIELPDSRAGVSAREIREALFAQFVKKAPGVDGIGFKALKLLWRWAEDRIVALVRGCVLDGIPSLHVEDRKRHPVARAGKADIQNRESIPSHQPTQLSW